VIRLGSLAGFSFEGPFPLDGWEPPDSPGVFAVMYDADPAAAEYAVVYIGHSDNLRGAGLPFDHPQAACWMERAGSKEALLVAWFMVPGAARAIRRGIASELFAVYEPPCVDDDQPGGGDWEPFQWERPRDDPPPGPSGSGGVREPRRPRPSPISGAVAAEPDN